MTDASSGIAADAPAMGRRRPSPRLGRTTLRTSRVLDFCSRKELTAQTGHQPDVWPLVILKELVDNALDAAEEAQLPPSVSVLVRPGAISVADNGPGLPADTIAAILDFTIRVSSREAYVAPDRGAQGNALKTLVAMPFVLDGQSGAIEVTACGIRHRISFSYDPIRQEPAISHTEEKLPTVGTVITVNWPNSACSILSLCKGRFLQIAEDYTWINPHLHLQVDWMGEVCEVSPTDADWPKWRPSDPTSAHWYSLDNLERLIAGYLTHDAYRQNDRTVREFISEFRGLSGSAKQKQVLDATGLHRVPLSNFVKDGRISTTAVVDLLAEMQKTTKPVKPPGLGIIGKAHLQQRFEAAGCEMESFDYRKVTDTDNGVPWVVETAFGYCPDTLSGRRLVTGVNWSPGIVNPFRELGTYGQSLDTILSQARADRDEPVILVLHMTCPRVEYTDRGKSSVVVRA